MVSLRFFAALTSIGFMSALAIAACAGPDQTAAIASLQSRVSSLEKQLKAVSDVETQLSAQASDNQQKITLLDLQRSASESQYKAAVLDPASRGYGRIDGGLGSFAVSLEDVRQFADSVKVRLALGNLAAATYSGAKLTVKYGSRAPSVSDPAYFTKQPAWESSLQTKEETVTDRLVPGHWNPVQIVLPGIDTKNLGYLEVSISTDQILMYK